MGNNPSGSYQTMVTIYSEEEIKTKLEKKSLWELKETTNYTWKKAKIDIHAKKRLKVLVPNVEKYCVSFKDHYQNTSTCIYKERDTSSKRGKT